jgi:hypothetical protein
MECVMVTEKHLAIGMKLQDMRIYDVYASREMMLAADADAGRISNAELEKRMHEIRQEYISTLDETAQSRARGQNSAAAGAIGAFATGVSQGQAAAIANQPVMCSSTLNGKIVNTLCSK